MIILVPLLLIFLLLLWLFLSLSCSFSSSSLFFFLSPGKSSSFMASLLLLFLSSPGNFPATHVIILAPLLLIFLLLLWLFLFSPAHFPATSVIMFILSFSFSSCSSLFLFHSPDKSSGSLATPDFATPSPPPSPKFYFLDFSGKTNFLVSREYFPLGSSQISPK